MLREPNALLMSVAFPLLLYPVMIWGTSEVFSLLSASREGEAFVVATADPESERLLAELDGPFSPTSAADPRDALARGDADAALVVTINEAGGLSTTVWTDGVRGRSRRAGELLEEALRDERDHRVTELSLAVGVDPDRWRREVVGRESGGNAATIGFLLSLILPQSLVLMGLMTTMYPALEAVVGERERGTLETVMVTRAARGSLILGKLGAVMAISLLGVVANLGAVVLTARHLVGLLKLDIGFELALGPAEIVAFLGLALLATTLSAAANLVAALPTRTFKQAQNAATGVVTVATMLSISGALEHAKLADGFAWLPYGGLILLMRAIINREPIAAIEVVTVVGLHAGLTLILFVVAVLVVRRESWWMR